MRLKVNSAIIVPSSLESILIIITTCTHILRGYSFHVVTIHNLVAWMVWMCASKSKLTCTLGAS